MAETETAQPVEAKAVGPKIKTRLPRQRACNEKNEKGKMCMGHLKRWFDYPPELEARFGAGAELYRCERCKTLYTPDPLELPRSYTLRY